VAAMEFLKRKKQEYWKKETQKEKKGQVRILG
jgi:hypothetical protein